MMHSDVLKRAMCSYIESRKKFESLQEEMCKWFGAIVSGIYDQQIRFTKLGGFQDAMIHSIKTGKAPLRGQALLACLSSSMQMMTLKTEFTPLRY